jgi:geranylgeranyl diphosphate synthase type I
MLYDILRYHFSWVDERGNPSPASATPLHLPGLLTLASSEAVCGDHGLAVSAAAAVELVYNFVLVHNDVQAGRVDQSDDRPSIWWVWGPSQAINAGDGLHALARSMLIRMADAGVAAETVLDSLRSLDQACLTLCEGQYMDLNYQDELMVAEPAYFDMIGRKSGALSGCAARLGAVYAGANDATVPALQDWGFNLGAASQIYSDIADLWGSRGDGFTASNVLNKKKSLPLIHALETSPTATKRELGNLYMKRVLEPDDARRVIEILDETGSRTYAEQKAAALLAQGSNAAAAHGVDLAQPEVLSAASEFISAGSGAAAV